MQQNSSNLKGFRFREVAEHLHLQLVNSQEIYLYLAVSLTPPYHSFSIWCGSHMIEGP